MDATAKKFDNGEETLAVLTSTLSPAERTLRASHMFSSSRDMLRGYLKEQHPEWAPEQIQAELLRRIHGAA